MTLPAIQNTTPNLPIEYDGLDRNTKFAISAVTQTFTRPGKKINVRLAAIEAGFPETTVKSGYIYKLYDSPKQVELRKTVLIT